MENIKQLNTERRYYLDILNIIEPLKNEYENDDIEYLLYKTVIKIKKINELIALIKYDNDDNMDIDSIKIPKFFF